MDCRTGDIHWLTPEKAAQFEAVNGRKLAPIPASAARELTGESPARKKNYMRNQKCPCGSNVKFKRCCWNKYS
jgi:uncharacterized protein YecA (UPF0149 family)